MGKTSTNRQWYLMKTIILTIAILVNVIYAQIDTTFDSLTIRFPFSLKENATVDDVQKLIKEELKCYNFEQDELTCNTRYPSLYVKYDNFYSKRTSFQFYKGKLYRIYLEQNAIKTCDDMYKAKESAQALVELRYSSIKNVKSFGDFYGEALCKYYMDEGLSFFEMHNTNWKIRIDTYFIDGAFNLYISFTYVDLFKELVKSKVKQNERENTDALNKL